MPRAVRLYTLDVDPTRGRNAHTHQVAQHSDPSLVLTLMLAREPRVTPAMTNPRRRAILAETRDAVTRALALYDLLSAADPADRSWFDTGREAAREVLTATQFGPFLFLEVDAPNHEVDTLHAQIAELDAQLTAARGGEAPAWVADRAKAWFTEIGMPQWSIPRRFDRAALDAKIKAAKRSYGIAPGIEEDTVRTLEYLLPIVIDEVERVADERVAGVELSAHADTPTIELAGTQLLVALPPTGWSTFARRRLLDALGMIPPTRIEYARGKV
ncbi:MAG: hypothetical protein ACKV2T_11675 [Kofleriaceae bacterium]